MQITLREPGSALTHFIAMIMAVGAAVPLLLKAASHGSVCLLAMLVFIISMILLYGASATYHSVNLPAAVIKILRKVDHSMILHTCLPSGAGPETGIPIADRSLVACIDRDRH